MIELLRVPTEGRKCDYVTPDGRWRIERQDCEWLGRWAVIDTTGESVCTSHDFGDGHATIERTLAGAKAFIAEWAA
jgi:hypothetical protein